MPGEEPKYNGNLQIIQANELIRSKQSNKDKLTLLEAKIVRLAIAQIIRNDTDFRTYSIDISRLAKLLKISQDNIYRDLAETGDSILRKLVRIADGTRDRSGKENYKSFHWIDLWEYRNGVLTLKLSDELKPYLVGLNELFTRYEYAEVLSLPSNNAIRLYELLASYKYIGQASAQTRIASEVEVGHGEIAFTVDYLKDFFDCMDKYTQTADFIKRVIQCNVNAINRKTIMQVTYRTVKEGHAIKYIVFHFGDIADKPERDLLSISGNQYNG